MNVLFFLNFKFSFSFTFSSFRFFLYHVDLFFCIVYIHIFSILFILFIFLIAAIYTSVDEGVCARVFGFSIRAIKCHASFEYKMRLNKSVDSNRTNSNAVACINEQFNKIVKRKHATVTDRTRKQNVIYILMKLHFILKS